MGNIKKKEFKIILREDLEGDYINATVVDEHGLDIYKEEWKQISKLITKDFTDCPDDVKREHNLYVLNDMYNKQKV